MDTDEMNGCAETLALVLSGHMPIGCIADWEIDWLDIGEITVKLPDGDEFRLVVDRAVA